MGASKSWYEVGCLKHGTLAFHSYTKTLKVSMPDTKKIRQSGCPLCKREEQAETLKTKN